MCSSKTFLFYGLFVSHSSLTFAAFAHKHTEGARRFIELVNMRRSNSTLKVGDVGSKALQEVSNKIWDRIKGELVKQVMREIELGTIAEMLCAECENAIMGFECGCCATEQVWVKWEYPDCPSCSDVVSDCPDVLNRHLKIVKAFLAEFGFVLPSNSPFKDAEDWSIDFKALHAIALPLSSSTEDDDDFPNIDVDAPHDMSGVESSVAVISPAIFEIPPFADARFARLVRDYGLEVSKQQPDTYFRSSCSKSKQQTGQSETTDTSPSSPKEPAIGLSRGAKRKRQAETILSDWPDLAQPQWRVWTVAEACD